jgi:hypothetical protein
MIGRCITNFNNKREEMTAKGPAHTPPTNPRSHTHTYTNARPRTHTHTNKHARSHAHAHTHTRAFARTHAHARGSARVNINIRQYGNCVVTPPFHECARSACVCVRARMCEARLRCGVAVLTICARLRVHSLACAYAREALACV